MSKYKCILWDWNGTLLDDLEVCIHVMNAILANRKLPLLTEKRYRDIFGFPVINYYHQLGFDFNKEPFEEISNEFITSYQRESLSAGLRENAVNMLQYIKKMGMKQIILSASQLEKLEEQVNHFGIRHYFQTLLGLNHSHATSKIAVGRSWLELSELNRDEILLVGDTLHDYETACELGCDCILLTEGHQSRERVAALGIPVAESLIDIKQYL